MADNYVVTVRGIENLDSIAGLPGRIQTSAQIAVNYAARKAVTAGRQEISAQLNLPPSYLSGNRFGIVKYATAGSDSAIIRARGRATSLARYVTRGSVSVGRPAKNAPKADGVTLAVGPKGSITLPRAFLIRLKAGTADLDTKSNLGLAIRLKPGDSIRNKRVILSKFKDGLILLYAPSVAQAFGGGKGVAVGISEKIADELQTEFVRQVDRLSK